MIQHGKGVLDDGLASRYNIYIFIGKSTFNMVHERTADMVLQTIILSGVSLFLLGILTEALFGFLLASELISEL